MTFRRFSVAIGSIVFIGALPAFAGQPSAPPSTGHVHLAATDPTVDKDSYVKKAQAEMQEWKQKIHDFGEKAEVKGHEASASTKAELNKAWSRTESASRKLKTASADGWQSAKVSYERASQHLRDTWHKIHPEDE
jgi:hypothetical protein